MTFTTYLKEGKLNFSNPEEMASELQATIKKIFPKSFVNVSYETNLGKVIYIRFTLGKDKTEWMNGIAMNDAAITNILLFFDKESENFMDGKMSAEANQTSLSVKPPENSYLAYGRIKTGWRKKKGTPDKIFAHIEKHFNKLKTIIKDNLGNFVDYDDVIARKKV